MINARTTLIAFVAITISLLPATAQTKYEPAPDALPQAGVPQGEIRGPFVWKSEIFAGTERNYWIYVPQQYDPAKPACVTIMQDGLNAANGWHLPDVLNNLIHKQEIPVTIGIFISPGYVPPAFEGDSPRINRSFEYDSMTDRYARFLVEEMLPAVSKDYNLSTDPNDRLIAGLSSGAICAFNVAWQRPNEFRRVLSTIGSYGSLRGGEEFSILVRKSEPKPIRIFLQDGSSDVDIYAGDWFNENQGMLSALEWAGYDVNHEWGDGGHNSEQAASLMPNALRWLWRNYPEPIEVSNNGTKRRTDILIPGEGWEIASEGHNATEGPAVNALGEVFFSDMSRGEIFRIGLDGDVSLFAENTGKASGLMFGADGRLYACARAKKQIVAYNPDGTFDVICEGYDSNDLAVGKHGIYFTDPEQNQRRVCYVGSNGQVKVVDTGIDYPNGVIFSPDQSQLYVTEMNGSAIYAFSIQSDGTLAAKAPFFDLHLAPERTATSADGMTVDTEGRVYVATNLGIQVVDSQGRVHLILEKPQDTWMANLSFGGENLDTLYLACVDKVYKRKLNATGVVPARL